MGKCQEAGQVWCRSGESQECSFCDSEDKKGRCGGEGLACIQVEIEGVWNRGDEGGVDRGKILLRRRYVQQLAG